MATSLTQTLVRGIARARRSLCLNSRLLTLRHQSGESEKNNGPIVLEQMDLETLTVQKIEDAIHGIIIKRSAPDWLPFRPGSSYWVPPRRQSYGIADLVNTFSNNLTDDEVMSLTTARGWPSSTFFTTAADESLLQSDEDAISSGISHVKDVE